MISLYIYYIICITNRSLELGHRNEIGGIEFSVTIPYLGQLYNETCAILNHSRRKNAIKRRMNKNRTVNEIFENARCNGFVMQLSFV